MTNEQLAVLLTSYRRQITEILIRLDIGLRDKDLDYHLKRGKWIGEGEEDKKALREGTGTSDYEWENGPPIILDDLKSFSKQLADNIWELKHR